jgi:hypothetical protein
MAEPGSIGMKDTAVSMQNPQLMSTQTFTHATRARGLNEIASGTRRDVKVGKANST